MPKVWDEKGFAFSFYSADGTEPPHIHVHKGGGSAKWWLDPVKEAWSHGFNRRDESTIRSIILRQREALLRGWADHFKNSAG